MFDGQERCEECNAELSYCGEMTADGPSLDCEVCQCRATIADLRRQLAEAQSRVNPDMDNAQYHAQLDILWAAMPGKKVPPEYGSVIEWAAAELKELRAVVERLPKDGEGNPLVPGVTVYVCDEPGHPWPIIPKMTLGDSNRELSSAFSTPEAAEAACKAGGGE